MVYLIRWYLFIYKMVYGTTTNNGKTTYSEKETTTATLGVTRDDLRSFSH